MLELVDGTLVDGPPVADSDQELIDFLVFLASRSEVNARSFSEAQPRLHLRLDGGSRLAAAAWVTTASLGRDPASPADAGHARRPRRHGT